MADDGKSSSNEELTEEELIELGKNRIRMGKMHKLEDEDKMLQAIEREKEATSAEYARAVVGLNLNHVKIKSNDDLKNLLALMKRRPDWKGRITITEDQPEREMHLRKKVQEKVDEHNRVAGEDFVVVD